MNIRLALISLLIFAGCSKQPAPSGALVVGSYTGVYKEGGELLELFKNNTFRQTLSFATAANYKNEGTWSLADSAIVFDGFIYVVPPVNSQMVIPRVKTDNVRGLWMATKEASQIVIDVEAGYILKKNE